MCPVKPPKGGAHGYPRVARVNELLREVLAESIERLSDREESLGMLTVTGVACTVDLRQAVVYLSSLSEEAAEVLEERRVQLQHEIATQVRMKRTPRLSFAVDPAVVHGAIVDDALRRIAHPEP
jgi:ribosome-binding factor A